MRIPFARVFWIGAAGIVVLAALVALVAIVGGSFSEDDVRVLLTLAALLYAGGTGLAGLAVAERGPARFLGRVVAAGSPLALGLVLWAIWSLDGGDEPQLKLAWSAVLVLLAGLLATTALLLARSAALVALARASGGLAALATALSVGAVWAGDGGDVLLKAIAALWILTAGTYFLVPILGRFSSAGTGGAAPELRVLAELDGVELVAVRSGNGLDVHLVPGERLALRRRP